MISSLLLGFGQTIKHEKKAIDVSSIASELAITPDTLRGIESGHKMPSKPLLARIAALFDFEFSRLATLMVTVEIIGKRFESHKDYIDRCQLFLNTIQDNLLKMLINESFRFLNDENNYFDECNTQRLAAAVCQYLRSESKYRHERAFTVRFAKEGELDMLRDWWLRLIPNAKHLNSRFLHDIYRVNPQIASVVLDYSNRPIGFYLLFPLTKQGLDERIAIAKRGEFIPINHRLDLLSSSFREAHGLWLGMVAGDNNHAAGNVIEALMLNIQQLFDQHKLEAILTRGMTTKGKNAMRRRGFRLLQSDHHEDTGVSILAVNDQWLTDNGLKVESQYT